VLIWRLSVKTTCCLSFSDLVIILGGSNIYNGTSTAQAPYFIDLF
jgi:hypothetical protein